MQYIPNESLTLIKSNKTKKKKFNFDILFGFASEAYSSIYPSTKFVKCRNFYIFTCILFRSWSVYLLLFWKLFEKLFLCKVSESWSFLCKEFRVSFMCFLTWGIVSEFVFHVSYSIFTIFFFLACLLLFPLTFCFNCCESKNYSQTLKYFLIVQYTISF